MHQSITYYILYINISRSDPQLFSLFRNQGALEAVTAPEPNIRFEVPAGAGISWFVVAMDQ